MGIKSNRRVESYYDFFAQSGLDGVNPDTPISIPFYGTRGVYVGGRDNVGPQVNTMDYVTISSTGNATDFGNLAEIGEGQAGCSNGTRGVFGGRYKSPSPSASPASP